MQNRYYVPSFHFDIRQVCYCGSRRAFGECCATAAPERSFPSSVKVVNNFIANEDCDQLVAFAERQKREWLTVLDDEKSTATKRVFKRHPNRVTQLVDLGKQRALVNEWMARACREHLPRHIAQPQWFESPQLLRYGLGGKYAMHSDSDGYCQQAQRFYRFIDRDFSILIYLNDDYIGGGLKFNGLNFSYQPKKGDLLIFPSNHIFSNESMPIESGTKYALVSWGAFKGSPRVAAPRQVVSLH